MYDPKSTAERYLAAWNEGDPSRRRERIAESWVSDGHYIDPMMEAAGHDALCQMIGQAREQFPGHSFMLRGEPDGHGAYVRFSWTLAGAEGQAIAGGTDIARLDEEGRISDVIGFLDGGPHG